MIISLPKWSLFTLPVPMIISILYTFVVTTDQFSNYSSISHQDFRFIKLYHSHSPWWCWFGGRWSVLLNLWTCREWLLAVASSKLMILLFWTRARANHTNYLSPTLKFDPPSLNWYFSCCGSSYTRTFSCISSRAVQVSWSVYCENGSTFLLRVPPKSTGSCVITAMNRRAFWRLIDVDNN